MKLSTIRKLVEKCTLPVTGLQCISRIYTSLAVIDVIDDQFVLIEKINDISFDDLQKVTGAELHCPTEVKELKTPAL